MKIIIINGPNLNLLKLRDKSYYGNLEISDIEQIIKNKNPNHKIDLIQSNSESEIINIIQNAQINYDGLIINPGGFSHTSISIRDALELCSIPKIEVHLSNISDRENFRSLSITASKCDGYISGFKFISYIAAVDLLIELLEQEKS